MLRTRALLLICLFILLLSWLQSSGLWKKTRALRQANANTATPTRPGPGEGRYKPPPLLFKKMKSKAAMAKSFTLQKGYNTSVCFLVDMSVSSGQNRFFVYDLGGDSIKTGGLVSHGNCNEWWLEGRKYGNTAGCGCTSLGKYKIGHPYTGRFGKAYKLYGLDKTNDKAFQRFVVLHSYKCVPETEVKDDICQSMGCPMVAVNFLHRLEMIIDKSEKPVLLWIYE